MNEQELINLWKAQDAKLEQTLTLNKKLLKEVVTQKAKTSLRGLSKLKTRGIISFCVYLVVLGLILSYAITHYSSGANYFIISIGAIFLINIKGLYDYIKHLAWVSNIDYDGNILTIQQKLSKLQFSIVKHSRTMTLQFPFFTTFYLSNSWFPQSVPVGYLIFQLALTGMFTYLSFWLYKNQTVENLDKKWYKILLAGSGGRSVAEALAFYKELEEYKKGADA